MPKKPALKAVLFDLDDTIIDWSEFNYDWASMERSRLQRVIDHIVGKHPLEDTEAYFETFRTRSMECWIEARRDLRAPNLGKVLIESAHALGVPENLIDPRECLEVYGWGAVHGTTIFPDVPAMLDKLKERRVKVGIVTNAYHPMWMRDIELTEHGIFDYFPECRFSAADVGYLKPHKYIFEVALECIGTKPEETVFIGDNPEADISGAQGLGMKAVLRTSNHEPVLSDTIIPNAVVSTFDDLPAVLDDWYPGWR